MNGQGRKKQKVARKQEGNNTYMYIYMYIVEVKKKKLEREIGRKREKVVVCRSEGTR